MMIMMVKLILSGITLIAITLLTISTTVDVFASPYGVGNYSANVPYGGQTQLSISTNGNVSISLTPTSSGTLSSASGTVTVVSSDVVGYKLYVRSLTSTNMTSGTANVPTSLNSSPAALAVNTWGYNLDASTNFSGMALTDTLIRSGTGPFTAGDVTTVTFGVKVDNTVPAGSYSNSVIYTAVPQTN